MKTACSKQKQPRVEPRQNVHGHLELSDVATAMEGTKKEMARETPKSNDDVDDILWYQQVGNVYVNCRRQFFPCVFSSLVVPFESRAIVPVQGHTFIIPIGSAGFLLQDWDFQRSSHQTISFFHGL